MAKKQDKTEKGILDYKRVEKLLLPIAAFLHAGGLPKKDAERIFSSIYGQSIRSRSTMRVEHIEHQAQYANMITRWTRDRRFVDDRGQPRLLPLRGKDSFSVLVKIVSPRANVDKVLSTFNRYRTVRRTREGMCELMAPYFSTSTPKTVAYEPLAAFLSDASATLARMLSPARRSRRIESFWRMVDSTNLTEAAARRFTIFVRERSQLFLEEVDDWLEACGQRKIKSQNHNARRRVGLGLFSIYSNS